MAMRRRDFLGFSAGASLLALSGTAWAASTDAGPKRLVIVLLRGAVDGLNVVVPYGEEAYYAKRPTIAIARPGAENGAFALDEHFGLHPALSGLLPLWQAKQLAFVHATGSPDPTRSHFDAQDYMESGTPGRKGTSDGWLNRALAPQKIISPVRAVSLGSALPRALRGRNDAVAVNNLNEFQVRDQRSSTSFESMYAGTLDKVLNGTGRETFDAVKLMQSIQKQTYTPANGARYPGGRLGPSLMQIARLIKADVGLEVAFTDMGGWDTHANEVGPKSSQGQLANLLGELGQSMAAFYQDLGDRMADVTIVTMSSTQRPVRLMSCSRRMDTATLGTHVLTVTGTDNAGNTASASAGYMVVADLGVGHGLAHGGSRHGERIRAKVDDVVHGRAYLVAVRSRWAARRPHSV
jgi:uncharacterized protein (DUF1501 family)